MTNENEISYALCFDCASVYLLSIAGQYTCPYCKHSVDAEHYKEILDYATSAVYYGYDYRKKYEEQLQTEGEIATVYCLEDPGIVACFIAAAVLSGIIGNASYDIVKKAINKIIEGSKEVEHDIGQKRIKISNETDIKVFVQYIQEYYAGNLTTVDEVKQEIAKEKIIFNLTKTLFPVVAEGNPSEEKIHDAIVMAFEETEYPHRPLPEDFHSFWKDIDVG